MSFVNDTFTDTAGTLLQSHTGEAGATWAKHPNFSGGEAMISDANRVREGSTGGSAAVYYASGSPASADYDVIGTVHVTSAAGDGGVWGRMDPSGAGPSGYWARYNFGTGNWELYSFSGGSPTLVGSFAQTLTVGNDYVVKLEMRGTAIKVYVDGVQRISVTDSGTSAAGKAGIGFAGGVTGDNASRIHVDNVSAADPASSLSAGTLANTAYGLTTGTFSYGTVTGGTAPYSTQLQKSPAGAGTWSNIGSPQSGATPTLTATGLTRGTAYDFRAQTTDSAGSPATVTSNTVTLTTRTSQLVASGNSLTAGAGGTSWATQIAAMLGTTWQIDNTAFSGQTTRDIQTNYAAQVGNYYAAANTYNLAVIQEVMNDIYFGQTAQQAHDNLKTLCLSARASGFKVLVLLSQPDRGDFPGTSTIPGANAAAQRANYQSLWASFLALFLADWRSFCDAFVYPNQDVRIVVSDATYINSGDLVHWTTASQGIVATQVTGAVAEALNAGGSSGGLNRAALPAGLSALG